MKELNKHSQLESGDITILVTGIGGFLGGHIARQLLARGYYVRGSVRHMRNGDKTRFALTWRPTVTESACSKLTFAPMPDGMKRSPGAAM